LSRLLKSSNLQPIYTGTKEIPVTSVRPLCKTMTIPDQSEVREMRSIEEQYAAAENECSVLIENANREAEKIRELARTEAERQVAKARQEGYQSGFEEGRIEAEKAFDAEYKAIILRTEQMVNQVETDRLRYMQNMSDVFVKITMESVRMLLARELEIKEPDIQFMVSELIQYVIDSTQIEVRVSPDDFPAAMASHAKWKGMKFGDWEVAIVPDMQISRGSCEIRSRIGRIDATMETKMNQLEDAIKRAISQLSAGEDYVTD
jgi:flagellar assembly protein FliH